MAAVCLSAGSSLASVNHPRTAVEQVLEDALAAPSAPCSTEDTDTSSTTSRSKPTGKSKKRYRAEERWILERLDRNKSCLLDEGQAVSSPESTSCGSGANSLAASDPVSALGILQLRRILRALGLPTVGTEQGVLAARLQTAVSSGVVESFVREAKTIPSESFQCVVQKHKAKAMLSLVETLISTPLTNSGCTTTISPKREAALLQPGSSGATSSEYLSDNSVHQDTNVQINQSGDLIAPRKEGGAHGGKKTEGASGDRGDQHPISNLGKSWKPDATSTLVPTAYSTTAATATVTSRPASIASDTPASPAMSSPVKSLRAVFSNATSPEARNKAPVAAPEEKAAMTNAKGPVETEVGVLSPVVDTHEAPTSVKSSASSSASSPIALKQTVSPAVPAYSDESCSSSSPTPGALPPSNSSSSPSVLWNSKTTPKAAATVAPAATVGLSSFSNMGALKQVFSGSKSPPSGNAPTPWKSGSKVSATATTILGPAKGAELPKKKIGGGRVAALVGAFDAKVKKSSTAAASLNGKSKEERGKLVVAGETKQNTGVAAMVVIKAGEEKLGATPNTQAGKEQQQQVPKIDRTVYPNRPENYPAQPKEHLELKGGQVPPVKITSEVIANDPTQVLNLHGDNISPTSNEEADNTDSPECSRDTPEKSPSEPVAMITTTSKAKEQVSPQGGRSPPRAIPLVKSISAPSSPAPSTASTATLSPTQPRSPASPSVSPKKFGSPSGSSASPHGNAAAVGTPTSKSKWGPPRATPLLAKTTSSPSSASTHLWTNASPASSLSRKIPMPASITGATGSATTSAVVNAPKAMVSPPATVLTSTASVPKKPVTATKGGTSGKRPPPPSGPAPPVPPRPHMINPSTVPVTTTPHDRAVSATPLTSCYNPLLPSQLAGVFSTSAADLSASAGGVPKGQAGATAYPALPTLTTGFSTSGPKFPSPPKVMVATSPSPVVVPEAKPMHKGKDIQVYYGDGEEDGSDKSEGRESDDEYNVNDSDSGSDEDDDDPALKILEPSVTPDWAKGKAVAEALERQYGGENPVNPNQIFVDFFTCNLETIFDTKKKKWARSSTGDWMTDRLTVAEKLAYDRAMGYTSIEKSKNSRKRGSRSKASPLRSSRNC